VSPNDDHAVKRIDLFLDNNYVATTACDDVSYSCNLNYSWSTTKLTHSARFKAYDWMGDTSELQTSFTVS
jgi:hypothetical protein